MLLMEERVGRGGVNISNRCNIITLLPSPFPLPHKKHGERDFLLNPPIIKNMERAAVLNLNSFSHHYAQGLRLSSLSSMLLMEEKVGEGIFFLTPLL